MATRGTIAMLYLDGHVEQVYTHWDSYVEHNGRILKEHYNTAERVKELISLGNLSVLAPYISGSPTHSFVTPDNDVCVFYGRDRRQSNTKARVFSDIDTFKLQMQKEEFDYLFVESELRWYLVAGATGGLIPFLSKLDNINTLKPTLSQEAVLENIYRAVRDGEITMIEFINIVVDFRKYLEKL